MARRGVRGGTGDRKKLRSGRCGPRRSVPVRLTGAVSGVYLLSKSHVSDAVRGQVIERARAGERIIHRTVAALVRGATGKAVRG
jgi:hypothetical protein